MRRPPFDRYHEALLSWLSIADICAGDFVLDVVERLTVKLVRAARRKEREARNA